MKRNYFRITTKLPIPDISKDDDNYSTLWGFITTPGSHKDRTVKLTQSNIDLINIALSILESVPLYQHSGTKDRLTQLLKEMS